MMKHTIFTKLSFAIIFLVAGYSCQKQKDVEDYMEDKKFKTTEIMSFSEEVAKQKVQSFLRRVGHPNIAFKTEDHVDLNEASWTLEAASNYLNTDWNQAQHESQKTTTVTVPVIWEDEKPYVDLNDLASSHTDIENWISQTEQIEQMNTRIINALVESYDQNDADIRIEIIIGHSNGGNSGNQSWPATNTNYVTGIQLIEDEINNVNGSIWLNDVVILQNAYITPWWTLDDYQCYDCLWSSYANIMTPTDFPKYYQGVRDLCNRAIFKYDSINAPYPPASYGLSTKSIELNSDFATGIPPFYFMVLDDIVAGRQINF
jgi:hypothetical protein